MNTESVDKSLSDNAPEDKAPETSSAMSPAVRLLGLVVLVLVGVGFFMYRAKTEADLRRSGLADPDEKKHLVTEPMTKKAQARESKTAPDFDLPDTNGKTISLKQLYSEKPVVIYFIKEGCPCSETYEPFIQEFARNYLDVAHFVGVMDGNQDVIKAWSSRFVDPYPILGDPSNKTMNDWEATNSAFTALVDKNGVIVAYWPGYSRWMLEELSEKLSAMTNVPRRRLAILDAPSQLYTGCSFGEEDPSLIIRPNR